jgi:hypothetical protein
MSSNIEIRIGRGAARNGATDSVAAHADSALIAAVSAVAAPTDSAAAILAESRAASAEDQVATVVGDDRAPDAAIHRLDAAIGALDAVDFALWSDSALRGHLDEVSLVLCRVDAQLARLADAVRARGFSITEVDLPLAS